MKKKILLLGFLLFVGLTNVSALEIPNSSYIIGKYILTRSTNDKYDGKLTTPIIMKAAKSISEDSIDNMKIYYKTASGMMINALTGDEIDVFSNEYDEIEDMANEAKSYNMLEIPEMMLDVTSLNTQSGKEKFDAKVETKYESEDNNYIFAYDIYGGEGWDGAIAYNSDGQLENENLQLLDTLSFDESYQNDVTIGKDYSYIVRPYICNISGDAYECSLDDRIYFDPLESVTVYAGASTNLDIVNNEMVVTVSGIDNYNIVGASMYAERDEAKNSAHIEVSDLVNLLDNNSESSEIFNNEVFMEIFNQTRKEKKYEHTHGVNEESYYYYIADMWLNFSDSTVNQVKIGDLGNSEKEENNYIVDVIVSSPDILGGRQITIPTSYAKTGIIYQSPISTDGEKTNLNLFDFMGFVASFGG